MNRSGRDAAGWLLDRAVRLLPPRREEWGRAMRAELSSIESGGARWRFTVGCLRVVASAVLRRAGHPLLVAGALVAVLGWTTTIGYAPLRWAVVGLVSILLALSWWGRRPGRIGPVGDGPAARLVRTGGHVTYSVNPLSRTLSAIWSPPPSRL